MAEPVDLTSLHEMIDGDLELEKELFREFFSSFGSGIAELQAGNSDDIGSEKWRTGVHSLKGIALNLGAYKLGELCKKGQDNYMADFSIRSGILKEIMAEYEIVKEFLEGRL
jgi:HPt (histidine-containing phosphotransfer) domain-containing protein